MMYGFAFIQAQCGTWEEKTEMTVVRVGSNLNECVSSTVLSKPNSLQIVLMADVSSGLV